MGEELMLQNPTKRDLAAGPERPGLLNADQERREPA